MSVELVIPFFDLIGFFPYDKDPIPFFILPRLLSQTYHTHVHKIKIIIIIHTNNCICCIGVSEFLKIRVEISQITLLNFVLLIVFFIKYKHFNRLCPNPNFTYVYRITTGKIYKSASNKSCSVSFYILYFSAKWTLHIHFFFVYIHQRSINFHDYTSENILEPWWVLFLLLTHLYEKWNKSWCNFCLNFSPYVSESEKRSSARP